MIFSSILTISGLVQSFHLRELSSRNPIDLQYGGYQEGICEMQGGESCKKSTAIAQSVMSISLICD